MRFYIFSFGLLISLFSCQKNPNHPNIILQKKVDSLMLIVRNSYQPKFGELMGQIQTHHAKLWFAGKNKNWSLADFEIHELQEGMEDITIFQKNRKETALIPTMNPYIDSLQLTIKNRDKKRFKIQFKALTDLCNSCHKDTGYEYIKIKIPEINTFRNQDF